MEEVNTVSELMIETAKFAGERNIDKLMELRELSLGWMQNT